ncbi:MAG: DUF1080 domain-containing protein [Candidatus Solibacter sp.]
MNRRSFLQSGAALAAAPWAIPGNAVAQTAPAASPLPLPPAGADGWVSLINGRNLDGFFSVLDKSGRGVAEKNGWVTVENGMLHIMGNLATDEPAEAGYLATTREFENYRLRAEYKWGVKRFAPRLESKRDNGLLYHLVGSDKVWPTCVECQIQEGDVCDYFLLGGARGSAGRGGGYFGGNLTPASGPPPQAGGGRGAAGQTPPAAGGRGAGQAPVSSNRKLRDQGGDLEDKNGWNVVECVVQGDSSSHLLNGVRLNTMSGFQQPDPQNPGQFIALTRGKIAIEIEFAEIWYRRLEVKSLV